LAYLNTKEVAEILGIGYHQISKKCKQGLFKDVKRETGLGRAWLIEESSVYEYLQKQKDEQEKIIGERYGELTILDILGYRPEGNGRQQRLFVRAGCECGNIVELPFYNIERGLQVRCNNECITKSGFQLGDQYGFLTIINDAGIKKYGGSNQRKVIVKCQCGTVKEYALQKLKSGEQNYCGKKCGMKELNNLIGKRFGYLMVLKEIERNETKPKERNFLCICDCGKKVKKIYPRLVAGKTKYCWFDCDLKKGEGSATWNPNLSHEERLKGRDYYEYKQWVKAVLKRDKYTCIVCDTIGGKLVAHHLNGYNWCVEKRTDLTNGITACENCHTKFHIRYGYGNNTKEQFEKWMDAEIEVSTKEVKIKQKVS
jgi:hypothetical protein